MTSSAILLPCLALVALTAIVWVRLYVDRIGEMRSRRIRAQALAASRDTQALQRVSAADNFRNLFEVPVLFYALCIAACSNRDGERLLRCGRLGLRGAARAA
jgi:hypothetical protein